MKHKVHELEGTLLDAAVAKAEGLPLGEGASDTSNWVDGGATVGRGDGDLRSYSPSTRWGEGGPIIDREGIELMPVTKGRWVASASGTDFNEAGPTPLVAAMRAFVASKLGEEVELP